MVQCMKVCEHVSSLYEIRVAAIIVGPNHPSMNLLATYSPIQICAICMLIMHGLHHWVTPEPPTGNKTN